MQQVTYVRLRDPLPTKHNASSCTKFITQKPHMKNYKKGKPNISKTCIPIVLMFSCFPHNAIYACEKFM